MARMLLFPVVALALLVGAPAAPAAPQPLPLTLTDDVVVGNPGGFNDDGNVPLDSIGQPGSAFATQATAAASTGCGADPDGLPDDAHFAPGDGRPEVTLQTHDANSGVNANRLPSPGDEIGPVAVGDDAPFQALDVIAVAANGFVDLTAELTYADSATPLRITRRVGDWLGSTSGAAYVLAGGLDRMLLAGKKPSCVDSGDAALIGVRFPVDPARHLTSVTFVRGDGEDGDEMLTLFHAMLLPPQPLTVLTDGAGHGTVSRSDPGVPCGAGCSSHPESARVKLTANPDADSFFVGFTAGCASVDGATCTVDVDAAKTITAYFGGGPAAREPAGGGLAGDTPPPASGPIGGDGPALLPAAPVLKTVRLGALVSLSTRGRCARRPRLALRLKPRDTRVLEVTAAVRPRSRKITGAALARAVVLRRIPRRAFTLRLVVRTGKATYAAKRRFRGCGPLRRRAA